MSVDTKKSSVKWVKLNPENIDDFVQKVDSGHFQENLSEETIYAILESKDYIAFKHISKYIPKSREMLNALILIGDQSFLNDYLSEKPLNRSDLVYIVSNGKKYLTQETLNTILSNSKEAAYSICSDIADICFSDKNSDDRTFIAYLKLINYELPEHQYSVILRRLIDSANDSTLMTFIQTTYGQKKNSIDSVIRSNISKIVSRLHPSTFERAEIKNFFYENYAYKINSETIDLAIKNENIPFLEKYLNSTFLKVDERVLKILKLNSSNLNKMVEKSRADAVDIDSILKSGNVEALEKILNSKIVNNSKKGPKNISISIVGGNAEITSKNALGIPALIKYNIEISLKSFFSLSMEMKKFIYENRKGEDKYNFFYRKNGEETFQHKLIKAHLSGSFAEIESIYESNTEKLDDLMDFFSTDSATALVTLGKADLAKRFAEKFLLNRLNSSVSVLIDKYFLSILEDQKTVKNNLPTDDYLEYLVREAGNLGEEKALTEFCEIINNDSEFFAETDLSKAVIRNRLIKKIEYTAFVIGKLKNQKGINLILEKTNSYFNTMRLSYEDVDFVKLVYFLKKLDSQTITLFKESVLCKIFIKTTIIKWVDFANSKKSEIPQETIDYIVDLMDLREKENQSSDLEKYSLKIKETKNKYSVRFDSDDAYYTLSEEFQSLLSKILKEGYSINIVHQTNSSGTYLIKSVDNFEGILGTEKNLHLSEFYEKTDVYNRSDSDVLIIYVSEGGLSGGQKFSCTLVNHKELANANKSNLKFWLLALKKMTHQKRNFLSIMASNALRNEMIDEDTFIELLETMLQTTTTIQYFRDIKNGHLNTYLTRVFSKNPKLIGLDGLDLFDPKTESTHTFPIQKQLTIKDFVYDVASIKMKGCDLYRKINQVKVVIPENIGGEISIEDVAELYLDGFTDKDKATWVSVFKKINQTNYITIYNDIYEVPLKKINATSSDMLRSRLVNGEIEPTQNLIRTLMLIRPESFQYKKTVLKDGNIRMDMETPLEKVINASGEVRFKKDISALFESSDGLKYIGMFNNLFKEYSTEKLTRFLISSGEIATWNFTDTYTGYTKLFNVSDDIAVAKFAKKDATDLKLYLVKECQKKRDMIEVHNFIAKMCDYLSVDNKVFEDKQSFLSEIEGKTLSGGYRISIPKETMDLVEIGGDLNICVGRMSYDQKIIEGKSIIIALESSKEKICIEFRFDSGRLKLGQATTNNNKDRSNLECIRELLELVNEEYSKSISSEDT